MAIKISLLRKDAAHPPTHVYAEISEKRADVSKDYNSIRPNIDKIASFVTNNWNNTWTAVRMWFFRGILVPSLLLRHGMRNRSSILDKCKKFSELERV
jgi:hypothetical protein